MKRFAELSEQEVLALAISNEDEDSRIYRSFADALRQSYPDTAEMYDKMAQEEIGHHDMLLDLYRKKFGDFLPLIRRQNVKGFVERRPIWLNRPLAIDDTRKFAEEMELETARFYRRAAETAKDGATRELLTKLAAAEDQARRAGARARQQNFAKGARQRGRNRQAPVHAAIHPARLGRPDGRLRLYLGAAVRRGVCHP